MRARSPWRVRVILALLGIVLIWILVERIGVSAIAAELDRLGPRSFLMLVPYGLGTALAAFPFALLLRGRVQLAASAAIASRFAASGANALLPFLGFAGEPCRLLWLPNHAHPSGLAAIVIDRLLYNFAGGLLLLVGAGVALTTRLPLTVTALAAVVAVFIMLLTVLITLAALRWGIGAGVHGLIGRFLGGAYGERELGVQVDTAMRALLRKPKGLLVRGLWLHVLGRAVLGVEVYIALWSLDAPTLVRDAVVLATVPVVTSLFASAIPSQIGVQEGAQALACAALGFDPALGLALVLLQRLRQLAFVPLTPLLIAGARSRNAERTVSEKHVLPQPLPEGEVHPSRR